MLGLQQADASVTLPGYRRGAVSCLIGDALGAVVIQQNYSRLVIDWHRMPAQDVVVE